MYSLDTKLIKIRTSNPMTKWILRFAYIFIHNQWNWNDIITAVEPALIGPAWRVVLYCLLLLGTCFGLNLTARCVFLRDRSPSLWLSFVGSIWPLVFRETAWLRKVISHNNTSPPTRLQQTVRYCEAKVCTIPLAEVIFWT